MKILITGTAGFIGLHVAQNLLYRLVQQHLETYLGLAREGD